MVIDQRNRSPFFFFDNQNFLYICRMVPSHIIELKNLFKPFE